MTTRKIAARVAGMPGALAWGFLDQGISSLTNFGLVLLVARRLGAGSLGAVAVGFAAYALALVANRALITDPYVVASGDRGYVDAVARHAAALTVGLAVIASAVVAVLGFVVPGPPGQGLLLFAPWILPALLQDFWRVVLFRRREGRRAVINDGAWLVAMVLASTWAWQVGSAGALVASWGIGASTGALLGFVQSGVVPSRPRPAMAYVAHIWFLGRWFALDKAALNLGAQGSVFLLASFLPAASVGGLRSVQSVFAPLTLLGPAIGLPGLPAMAQALERSPHEARRLAAGLSLLLCSAVLAYSAAMAAFGGGMLAFLFGPSFRGYGDLIMPVAAGQVLVAAAIGFVLFTKAARRPAALFGANLAGAVVALVLAGVLGTTHGVTGGAWGISAGLAVSTVLVVALASRLTPAPSRREADEELHEVTLVRASEMP